MPPFSPRAQSIGHSRAISISVMSPKNSPHTHTISAPHSSPHELTLPCAVGVRAGRAAPAVFSGLSLRAMPERAPRAAFAALPGLPARRVLRVRGAVRACTAGPAGPAGAAEAGEGAARPAPRRLAKKRGEEAEEAEEGGAGAGADDVGGAYSVGEALRAAPALNSSKMNAMRDYFGDDGREVQDYTKRARDAGGRPMFRVLLVGSGDRELGTARALSGSGVVTGLYYCPDGAGVCDIRFTPFATSTGVSAYDDADEVLRFARWALVDAVFVGPDRDGCVDKATEKALAAAGVTVFPHDVSAMIADGALAVADCLASIAESGEAQTAEQLVE